MNYEWHLADCHHIKEYTETLEIGSKWISEEQIEWN